jgi:exosome complex component RRP42
MNEELKEHINECLKAGIRIDGRTKEALRSIEIETGFLTTAEGSARVKCGETEVIAGVKMSIGTPFGDTPEDGVLMVNAELLPLSNPDFESGPPSSESIELARVIDRGIRESKMIDTKALCITKGEKVWMVNVDICPLNTDGNLLDIGAFAAVLALKNACFPTVKDGAVDYKKKTTKKIPLKDTPITITVLKIGENYIVDPTDSEEKALDARLTVAILPSQQLCAMQKGGNLPLALADIEAMINLAIATSQDLRHHLR